MSVTMALLLGGVTVCLLIANTLSETNNGYSGGYYPPQVNSHYNQQPNTQYSSANPTQAPPPTAPDGPIGPTSGGFGPGFSPAFFPPYGDAALIGLSPGCAKFEIIKTHLYTILEPVFVGFVGVVAFLIVKNLVLPYLGYFARALEEEEDRSLGKDAPLDAVARTVLKAVARGVCIERIACQMGMKAKDYTLTNAVVRAIDDSTGVPQRLAAIFRDAATGQMDTCEPYTCKGASAPIVKFTRKRKHNTANDIHQ